MDDVDRYLPGQINRGSLLVAYSLDRLLERRDETFVLPICSLGTPVEQLEQLGELVLPPLYHEALDEPLKQQILKQIRACFPFIEGTRNRASWKGELQVVELPAAKHRPPAMEPDLLAFSVDTAVEEHGPQLPLATDTIQSYAVLRALREQGLLQLAPPVEYGHLTWGLPFGMSIDLTPHLLRRYVERFTTAVCQWSRPRAVYVVDVHGSPVHRQAIQDGLADSACQRYRFRWLYDPLVPFAGERGDQHAGGVETAVVETIGAELLDSDWWPSRMDELAAKQMSMQQALELHDHMPDFVQFVEQSGANGIVGEIRNYHELDGADLLQRMIQCAAADVAALRRA